MFAYETQLRLKDEELYAVKKENVNLISDLKNLSNMEQSIWIEVINMNKKRSDQEELIQ